MTRGPGGEDAKAADPPAASRAVAALVLHMVIAAVSYPILAYVARHYPPLGVLALRALLGALLLGVGARLLGALRLPEPGDALRFFLLGMAGIPVNQGLLLLGLARTEVSHAAILYALTPVFVAVVARLTLGERLGSLGGLGVLTSLIGALVVLGSRAQSLSAVLATGPLFGDLLILGGVLGWVAYTVMSKPLVARYGVFGVTTWAHVAGAAVAIPVGLPFVLTSPPPSGAVLLGVAALAVGTSFVNYLLWSYALRHLKTAAVAVSANLQPPLAALLAWALGHERPTGLLLVGGALVLAGVTLTLRARARSS